MPGNKFLNFINFKPDFSKIQTFINQNRDFDSLSLVCQTLDIPFIPTKFHQFNFKIEPYYALFQSKPYAELSWKQYHDQYLTLEKSNLLTGEVPLVSEAEIQQLKEVWGQDYNEFELRYLESLYQGVYANYALNDALRIDQARKLVKLSLQIDKAITANISPEKLLAAYEKLIKVSNFDPSEATNANDFESLGEIIYYLEKIGWKNSYTIEDDTDIVDNIIKNQQSYVQRLYTNEDSISENIKNRIEGLRAIGTLEENLDTPYNFEMDTEEFDFYETEDFQPVQAERPSIDDLVSKLIKKDPDLIKDQMELQEMESPIEEVIEENND